MDSKKRRSEIDTEMNRLIHLFDKEKKITKEEKNKDVKKIIYALRKKEQEATKNGIKQNRRTNIQDIRKNQNKRKIGHRSR